MSESVVYVIRAGEMVKIGVTTDLPKRLDALQNANGTKLDLIGTMPGGVDQERLLHKMFGHLRQQGEWFVLGESDLLALSNVLDEPYEGEVPSTPKPRESKYDRAERNHRCTSTDICSGERMRCHLPKGHRGDHETEQCGAGWTWDNPYGWDDAEAFPGAEDAS